MGGSHKYRVWGQKELAALRLGVIKHGVGNWELIRSDPELAETLSTRSGEQIKDKWRNLVKFNHVTPEELEAAKLKARKRGNVKRSKTFNNGSISNGAGTQASCSGNSPGAVPSSNLQSLLEGGASAGLSPGTSVGEAVSMVPKNRRPVRPSRTLPDMRAMASGAGNRPSNSRVVKRQSSARNLILANHNYQQPFSTRPQGLTSHSWESHEPVHPSTDMTSSSPDMSLRSGNSDRNGPAKEPFPQWQQDLNELDTLLGLVPPATRNSTEINSGPSTSQLRPLPNPEPVPNGVPAAILNNVGWPSIFLDRRLYLDPPSHPGLNQPPPLQNQQQPLCPASSGGSLAPNGPPRQTVRFNVDQLMGCGPPNHTNPRPLMKNVSWDLSGSFSTVAGDLRSTEMDLTLQESLARLSFDGLSDFPFDLLRQSGEPMFDVAGMPGTSGLPLGMGPPDMGQPGVAQPMFQQGPGGTGGMEYVSCPMTSVGNPPGQVM